MPRYAFRCTVCGSEFEVSRSIRDAGAPASCPVDGSEAERIFTVPQMNFNRPRVPASPAAPVRRGFSHAGHTHGPGTADHTH